MRPSSAGCIFSLTTVTANRNIVALGYSYRFDTENEQSWTEVLRFMGGTYKLNDRSGVSISDGDKGIARAHRAVFPLRGKFRCFEHKKHNLQQHVKGLNSQQRTAAISAYVECVRAATQSAWEAGWNRMPDEAKGLFPQDEWREYFSLMCDQELHGWYTSSVAESENNALADIRALDPCTALATIVERCADRMSKQQLFAIEHAQMRDQVMPGVPPDVVKRLKDTRELAAKMSSARTQLLGDGVWQVGRLGHSLETWKVDLINYKCCPALQLSRYPCVHICHVCSVANVSLSVYMPKCHTESGWRAQLGLPPTGAANQRPVEVNPIPHMGRLMADGLMPCECAAAGGPTPRPSWSAPAAA